MDHAFNIAERELGVTKLLDAEDVDCPHPDEKSLITYISSLYELFPEPPENNPLLDRERIKQIEGYKKLAEDLVNWMKESTRRMNERSFPCSLKEMKKLQEETNHFRTQEIPPRYNDKQLLVNSYKEILKMALALPVRIEDEYKADSIEASWKVMLKAVQERDKAIKDHMYKLEDLENIAEKLRKNIKECDRKLDEIQYKVVEVEKTIHKVNPLEPNYAVEEIQRELKYEEERINMMFKDAKYLVDENYPRAQDLYNQVQMLQDKYNTINMDFETKILAVLEERRAAALRRPMTESELVASNPTFKFLHDCIEWCKEKHRYLSSLDYGTDIMTVQKRLDEQINENRVIEQFQTKVNKCDMARTEFEGEVLQIYENMLKRLHKHYNELKVFAEKRHNDLEALLELLKALENENKWIDNVIAPEILRNWSLKDINFAQVEEDHRKLYYEIQTREPTFDALLTEARRLLDRNHPAAESITNAVNFFTFKRNLLVEMFKGLEKHKVSAFEYHKYYKQLEETMKWIRATQNKLNTTFSVQVSTFEEGDQLNRDMIALKDEINGHRKAINDLEVMNKSVSPLKLRTSDARSAKATSLVMVNGNNIRLSEQQQLTIKDNSDAFAWSVVTLHGDTYKLPNLCFHLPPPDKEALGQMGELKQAYEDLIGLWAQKHHELRQNMLLATIRNLKGWDYPTYCSKDPNQRDAILKALENDIDKVVRESQPGDRKSQQLLDEFDDLKKKFAEYEARRKAELDAEALKKILDAFVDDCSALLAKLQEKERIIVKKLHDPIPRKLDEIKSLILSHRDFESDLKRYESDVERITNKYKSLPSQNQAAKAKYEAVMDLWHKIRNYSNIYIELLKSLDIVCRDLQEATQLVANIEINLAKAQDMPADIGQTKAIFDELKRISDDVQRYTNSFDKLLSNVTKVRRVVERNRAQHSNHADVDRLEEDVKQLHKRWDNIALQVVERFVQNLFIGLYF